VDLFKSLHWNYILPNVLPATLWAIDIRIYLLLYDKKIVSSIESLFGGLWYIIYIILILVISVFVWGTAFAARRINEWVIYRYFKINEDEITSELRNFDINNRIVLSTSLYNLSFPIVLLSILSCLLGQPYRGVALLILVVGLIAFLLSIYYSREIFIIQKAKIKYIN
jgi:hypothetical protein